MLAGVLADYVCLLPGLFSSDVETDGDGNYDHDSAPECNKGLASRPVGTDTIPLEVVPVYYPLGRL